MKSVIIITVLLAFCLLAPVYVVTTPEVLTIFGTVTDLNATEIAAIFLIITLIATIILSRLLIQAIYKSIKRYAEISSIATFSS
jgi:hypothetical protein